MKLNWFSPLPPARTSIADDYLAGILPALAANSELTLWTDQNTWDSELEKLATVRRYQPERVSWPELNRAGMTFYNSGNNHLFHTSIWQVSRLHPGIVILHDLRVHNFFDSLYRGRWRDPAGYLAQMKKHYGEEGLRAATEFVYSGGAKIESMLERYPLTPLALENSLGAVVHTQEAFAEVQRLKRWPVVYAPLPRSMPPPNNSRNDRPLNPPYRLIMFGYMGRNRRLDAVLEALSGLPERDDFRLDIFGEIDDARGLRSRIRNLKLDGLVQLHGYAAERELNQVLETAHLAINLRYPTMGEASGSQLRIWYHALPSLVTDVGWYSTLPSETVARVRPEFEIADIQTHLRDFLKEPARFVRMGENGLRALRENHAPETYVRAILEVAANATRYRLGKSAIELAQRAGESLGAWTTHPTDARRVAEKIYALTAS